MGLGRGLECGSLSGGRLAARPPPGVVRSVFVWSYFAPLYVSLVLFPLAQSVGFIWSGCYGPMYIWALFTSGYNNVGTGVWDYRLSRMCCAAVAPPLRFGRGGGGGAEYCHSPTVYRLLMSSLKIHKEKCETIKPHRIATTKVTNTRFKHHARARQRSV